MDILLAANGGYESQQPQEIKYIISWDVGKVCAIGKNMIVKFTAALQIWLKAVGCVIIVQQQFLRTLIVTNTK